MATIPEDGQRWLDAAELAKLAATAEESPNEFNAEFDRLGVLKKVQVRRYMFERQKDGGSFPSKLTLSASDAAPDDADVITSEKIERSTDVESAKTPDESKSLEDAFATPAVEESVEEETAESDEADSLEAAFEEPAEEVTSLEAAFEEPAEEVTSLEAAFAEPDEEAASLDDLFGGDESAADSLDDLFGGGESASESSLMDDLFADEGAGGDSGSLDDLFADEGAGGESLDDLFGGGETATAVEDLPETPDTKEGEDYPLPDEYGRPTTLPTTADEICETLKSLDLYRGIEVAELIELAMKMDAIKYRDGDLLCRAGDKGDVMWIVREGAIKVILKGRDLGIRTPAGNAVGEMALLDGQPRSAALVAEGETVLFRFSLDGWTQTFRDAPDAGLAFMRNLARMQQDNLRDTNEKAVAAAVAKAEVEQEMKQAEQTQRLALPKGIPDFFGDGNCAVTYTGARGVSGDYYDFIEFEDDPDRILVIFADSTGHGLNAGLLMLLARSAAHTQFNVDSSVAAITEAINNVICDVFGATLFLTYVIMLIDRKEQTIEFTNAGQQSHPYLYRMESGEFVPLGSQTFQLGIQPGATYISETIEYSPNDLLVCYSDGIIEAPYYPEGADDVDRDQEFGDDRLRELIEDVADKTPQQVIDRLQGDARKFCLFFDTHMEVNGKVWDGDDITNVVIRMT